MIEFIKKYYGLIFAVILLVWIIYSNGIVWGLIFAVGYVTSAFILVWFINQFTKLKDTTQLKIITLIRYIGFGSFFVWIFLNAFVFINTFVLMWIGLMSIGTSIMLTNSLPKKKAGKTIDEKIRNELKITSKTYKKNLPRLIGGFVMPSLPFISVLNKKWKKRNKEAVIHENIHLYYLQQGAILYYLGGLLIFLLLIHTITKSELLTRIFGVIFTIFAMVFFEYITFKKTNFYGEKFKIKTNRWNKHYFYMYFIIYAIQIMIVYSIILGIQYLIKLI